MIRTVFLFRLNYSLLLCALCVFALAACGASSASRSAGRAAQSSAAPKAPVLPAAGTATPVPPPAAVPVAPAAPASSAVLLPDSVDVCWLPLVQRLKNDPAAPDTALRYFSSLPAYSPQPMGTKIKELFTSAFMRKPPSDGPKKPPSRIYRNVVTAENLAKCNAFLTQHKASFDAVEKKYPVPKEVLVALLFVETRLGTYMGKDNAFWSLACMAAADSPGQVQGGLGDIPITDAHSAWLQSKLDDKSGWAYKELRALLVYCSTQQLDPHTMPGSVYGAIGMCQFMPSNLVPYGDDGDGDGVINLFSEADAIFSAARYLTRHGWQAGASVEKRRSVLKRYNNLNIYANTILTLAESIRTGVLQSGPPDALKAAPASKKSKKAVASGKGKAASGKGKASSKDKSSGKGKAAPASGKSKKSAAQQTKKQATPGGTKKKNSPASPAGSSAQKATLP